LDTTYLGVGLGYGYGGRSDLKLVGFVNILFFFVTQLLIAAVPFPNCHNL
jgi:hypothetical protein